MEKTWLDKDSLHNYGEIFYFVQSTKSLYTIHTYDLMTSI